MALLDLIGRRWSLRVLWELRAEGAKFEDLRSRCDEMSTSVLALRLKELRQADLVHLDPAVGWRATEQGLSLLQLLTPLSEWSMRWAERLAGRKSAHPVQDAPQTAGAKRKEKPSPLS